jgi:hypothetical protein
MNPPRQTISIAPFLFMPMSYDPDGAKNFKSFFGSDCGDHAAAVPVSISERRFLMAFSSDCNSSA